MATKNNIKTRYIVCNCSRAILIQIIRLSAIPLWICPSLNETILQQYPVFHLEYQASTTFAVSTISLNSIPEYSSGGSQVGIAGVIRPNTAILMPSLLNNSVWFKIWFTGIDINCIGCQKRKIIFSYQPVIY